MWHISAGTWQRGVQGYRGGFRPHVLCGENVDWLRMEANHLGSGMPNVIKGTEGITDRKFVTSKIRKVVCQGCLDAMDQGVVRPGLPEEDVPF